MKHASRYRARRWLMKEGETDVQDENSFGVVFLLGVPAFSI